jgi:hypothetical protein
MKKNFLSRKAKTHTQPLAWAPRWLKTHTHLKWLSTLANEEVVNLLWMQVGAISLPQVCTTRFLSIQNKAGPFPQCNGQSKLKKQGPTWRRESKKKRTTTSCTKVSSQLKLKRRKNGQEVLMLIPKEGIPVFKWATKVQSKSHALPLSLDKLLSRTKMDWHLSRWTRSGYSLQ